MARSWYGFGRGIFHFIFFIRENCLHLSILDFVNGVIMAGVRVVAQVHVWCVRVDPKGKLKT